MQVIIIVGFPLLAIWGTKKSKALELISPIVLCFAIGILVCNFNLIQINEKVSNGFRDGAILLALPLLLFSSDIVKWIKESSRLLWSFLFCIISGLVASTLASFLFVDKVSEIWIPAGMMVGIYTGGTPNLFAVGIALNADNDVFTLLNSAEIFWGGLYLLFLLSYGPAFFKKVLPVLKVKYDKSNFDGYVAYEKMKSRDVFIGILIAITIVAFSAGSSTLITGSIDATIVIVMITSLSILASFKKLIRNLQGTFELGDYFLLMFGVAAGMLSDFKALVTEGGHFILFVFVILIITLCLHLLLCKIFKIDRDTYIITSTAGLYGPVFVPQVARALGNRSIIVGGIAVSLIGLAVGNYIGISLGQLLRWWFG